MSAAIILSLLGILALQACKAPQSFALQANDLWIRDVTIVSLERTKVLPNAHVVIRGDTIAWVGAEPPIAGSSQPRVIEGRGRHLVAGLIDGHVHLAQVPGLSRAQQDSQPAIVAAYYEQLPRSYLYFGFTTVVDVNVTDRGVIERLRATELAPTILDCGSALVIANGYPMRNRPWPARFERYPNFLYDARQADSIPARYSAAEHSPRAAVARVASGGGACVKAFYEAGPGQWPVPTLEMMQEVNAEGDAKGLPLLLHANSVEAHSFAAKARVDAVAHGLWNWGVMVDSGPNELPARVRAVLDSVRAAGIGYMPTLRVMSSLHDLYDPAFLNNERLAHVLPAAMLAWLRTPAAQWYEKEELNPQRLPNEQMKAVFGPWRRRGTAYMAAQGARFVFGSDTPSDQIYTNPPGLNGYLELREMEAAGVSPRQILAAATIENAKLFRIEKRYGTIERGKVASLLLLREDPLASTSAYDTIDLVLVRGRVIERHALSGKAR